MTFGRGIAWFVATALAGCQAAPMPEEGESSSAGNAKRIVSLDYCADQYLLKLVDPVRILAVSQDADKSFSYMREAAHGLPKVRPSAEDVLALEPDLVVRAYGGGPNAQRLFENAGIPVLNVGWSPDIQSIKSTIMAMAEGLDAQDKGRALVAEMDARMEALPPTQSDKTAMYMTPTGVTTGPGSHVHQMFEAAGLENFQTRQGWQPLPLERLIREQPDMIAAAFFSPRATRPNAWSAARHPVARRQLKERHTVFLDGAWTSCGSWYILDAIEALADGARKTQEHQG